MPFIAIGHAPLEELTISHKMKKCDRITEQSCKVYVDQLRRMFPDLRVEFVIYGTVSWWEGQIPVVEMRWSPRRYDDANHVWENLPEHWDEEAKQQLQQSKFAHVWQESISA